MTTKVMYGILDTKTKMYVSLKGSQGCEFSSEPDPRYLYVSAQRAFASLSHTAGYDLIDGGSRSTWVVTEVELVLRDNGPALVGSVQNSINNLAVNIANQMIVKKYSMPLIVHTKGHTEGWIVLVSASPTKFRSIGITKFINLGTETYLLEDEDDVALLALHERLTRVVNLKKALDERDEIFNKIHSQLIGNYTD